MLLPQLAEEVVAEMRDRVRGGLLFDRQRSIFVYDGDNDLYREHIAEAEVRYGVKLRDHRAQQVEKNAKKRGFRVKERKVTEDGKVLLVLARREYD